jgi:hypothetical protein
LIITHDNRDIGMGPLFQHALVLSASQVRGGEALSLAMEQALSRFRPNEWGYT